MNKLLSDIDWAGGVGEEGSASGEATRCSKTRSHEGCSEFKELKEIGITEAERVGWG